MGVLEPDGVQWALAVANRNFLIHQYDQIDRSLTWLTLVCDLPAWRESLQAMTADAGWTRTDILVRYTRAHAAERAALEARRLNLGDL